MAQEKNTNAKYSSLTGIHRAVPIILFAAAVFTAFCLITRDVAALGNFGKAISTVFLGLFSSGAYAIPLLLILHAVFYASDISEKRLRSRIIFSIVAITFIAVISYTITYWKAELFFNLVEFFKTGKSSVGGGVIGGTVGFCLVKIFGRIGVIIIAAAVLAIYVSYFFATGKKKVSSLLYNILKFIVIVLAYTERGIKNVFKKIKNSKDNKVKRVAEHKSSTLTDDDFFAVDNGMQQLSVSELGIRETRDSASFEGSPTLHDKIFYKSAVSPEEAERMAMREKAEEMFYASTDAKADDTAELHRRRLLPAYEDDSSAEIAQEPRADEQVTAESPFDATQSVARDDSAESVFTQSFDPFSMMMSEELASKPSSRSLLDEQPSPKRITEDISELTEAEIERERRLLDFERRKAAIVESRKAIPVDNDGEFTGTPKTVAFRERSDERLSEAPVETASSSFTFDKADKTAEPPLTTPANYTPIGFGDDTDGFSSTLTKPAFTSPQTIYSYEPKEEAPENDSYTVYEAPVTETVPATAAYVEEPEVQIFERKAPTVSYNDYSPVSEPTPTVTEDPEANEEVDEVKTFTIASEPAEEEPDFSYTATKDFDEPSEEYVPEFKPYQVFTPEDISESDADVIKFEDFEEEEDISTLTVEREYVGYDESEFEEDYEFDGEEYEEELDTDLTVPPEDDGDGYEDEEIPPEEQNPVVQGYKDMFSALRDEQPEEQSDTGKHDYELISPDEVEDEDEDDYDEPPFEHATVKPESKPKTEKKEEPIKKKPDFSNYKYPPIDLLGLDPEMDDDRSDINENQKILIDTLASFNVTASIKGVDRGPRITRYEVVPARGVKVQSITNLFNDIALNLAKEGIRMEAPIPGKSAIGFEIPNKTPKNVRLRELIECEEFSYASSKTFAGIGKDVAGNPVFGDIAKYPHALICGATGMGKSVCINSILVSILYKARPDEVKLIMVDPKKVEFRMYSGIPHLLIPVITEAKQAAGALMWAVEEMERRYELIEQNNIRNIEAYNEKVKSDPSLGEPLPKIIIVIDELADLMMMVRDPVEDLIMRIAQKARAAGIHLIIGTQRPSVQVITGAIKANIPSRLSCKVTSQVDSRTIFDMGGAEKLLNRGDMLYWPVDRTKALRVQGAFVSDQEVENVMAFLKSQVPEGVYDEEIFAEINKAAQKCGNKKSSSVSADDIDDDGEECGYYSDQQFLDAVELAIRSKKISTSLLQRKLSIGYGKAAKYIDAMEEIGIVSEPKGQKPRDVLLTLDEWHEKLSRVDLG